jgi:magnesium chelatase family protein
MIVMFMLGNPEAGTFMLACCLTPILPDMTLAKAIERTRIHRGAGLTDGRTVLGTTCPFHAPHYPSADVGLIDGEAVSMPVEVLPAHYGVPERQHSC